MGEVNVEIEKKEWRRLIIKWICMFGA